MYQRTSTCSRSRTSVDSRDPALAALWEAQRSPSDRGVVAHALAALRSRLPWRCTVHNWCFAHMYIGLVPYT